jgi:glucose dehydrogenase
VKYLSIAAVAAFAWVALAQQPKRVDSEALKHAAKNGGEWITYGRDFAETHYGPLKQIDTSNAGLGVVLGDGMSIRGTTGSYAALFQRSPHGSLAWDVLFAVDARTGKMKWRRDPEIELQHISQICCGR